MALVEKYSSAAGAGAHDGSSEANAFSWAEMVADINAGNGAGIRYNHKGDITFSESVSITNAGTIGSPCIIRGYKTTIGDGYQGRTNQGWLNTANMPLLTFGTNLRFLVNTSGYFILDSFDIVGDYDAYLLYLFANYSTVCNVHVVNSGGGASASAIRIDGVGSVVINCDGIVTGSGASAGISIGTAYNRCILSHVKNTGGGAGSYGIIGNNYSSIASCVVHAGTKGIFYPAAMSYCINNTIYKQSLCGIELENLSMVRPLLISGNVITDCLIGIYNPYQETAANPLITFNNFLARNGTNYSGFGDWPTNYDTISTELLAETFADAENDDLRLVRTSGAVNAATNGGDIGGIQRPAVWAAATDLRSGTTVDGITGTLDLPAVSDVQEGVVFDNTTKTGNFVSPSEDDVRYETTYGAAAEYTGNLVLPEESTVQDTIQYGTDGTEYTGTYIGIDPDYPSEDDVQFGVLFGDGVYAGNFVVPAVGNVQESVQYGANGTEYTGTFVVPAESDVRIDISYGDGGEYTGTYYISSDSSEMTYVVYYSKSGEPQTGLSPTIDIFKRVANSTNIADPPEIEEIGGGFYKFTYSAEESVVARIDSNDGTMEDADRYKVLQLTTQDDIVTSIFSETPTASGNVTFSEIVKYLHGMAKGKIVKSSNTFTFYDDDNTTELYSFTVSDSGRTIN